MALSVELHDEIEVQMLNKLAEVFVKEDPAIIEDDLADDFIYSSEGYDFIAKKDFNSYMRNKLQGAKKVGITSILEVVEIEKAQPKCVIGKVCPEEPVDDISVLDFKTLSSKYRLIRHRFRDPWLYDLCYQILLDDNGKVLVIEELSCEPRTCILSLRLLANVKQRNNLNLDSLKFYKKEHICCISKKIHRNHQTISQS